MAYKMVFVVRTDLALSTGKTAAQVGHAVTNLVLHGYPGDKVLAWLKDDPPQTKIVLAGTDLDHLNRLADACELQGLVYTLIQDAGKTEVAPGTITVLGIGPDLKEKIDLVTGGLKRLP